MKRIGFILDQQVGLQTQAQNWQRVIEDAPEVAATWVPVRYVGTRTAAVSTRMLRLLPKGMSGSMRGVQEIRQALGTPDRVRADFDALFWGTWAAKLVRPFVRAVPSFLTMDLTPTQMEAMGAAYGYSKDRARFLGGWKQRASVALYRDARHVFPWSEWAAASLRDDYGLPADRVTPISPGVDVSLFRPCPEARKSERDGVVRVLFVGGHFQRKGGDLLLRWMQSRPAAVELHLVTRDPVPPTPGVVTHHGITNLSDELIQLYQQSDVFVLPTRADCYSMVGLEAMASGLPVVLSAIAGIPEMVREGETGFLIQPDDYETLADRLDRLVRDADLRRGMGDAARRHACERFDCHKTLRSILDVIQNA